MDPISSIEPLRNEDLRQTALISSLRRCQIFSGLAHDDIVAVAECCVVRSLEKGQRIFREGEPTEGFCVMQSGRICISRTTPEGKETVLAVFSPPESFAEATLDAIGHYPADATALEPSQAILVRKAPFRDLICRKPELALRMLASMSLHLKYLVQTLPDHRHVEARLASWIVRFCPAAASRCPAAFVLPMPKKILAGQLGTTSETLSRTFARFSKEGILHVVGPKIVVRDSAALRAYADRG